MSDDNEDISPSSPPERPFNESLKPPEEAQESTTATANATASTKATATATATSTEATTNANKIDFLRDSPAEMTYGRQLALWLNHTFPVQYGPESSPTAPSLEKAWAFFEHVTLERHLVDENDVALAAARSETTASSNVRISKRQRLKRAIETHTSRKFHSAEPGERQFQTHLYPILRTPLNQMGDFGLGFGLYFTTLRDFAILAFLGGLLSLPNIIFFASTEYDANGQEGVPALLRGSAICTDRTWVPCPTCKKSDFERDQAGTYSVKRFTTEWAVKKSDKGDHLNVTTFWLGEFPDITEDDDTFQLTSEGLKGLESLNGTFVIPKRYGNITLDPVDGYFVDGVNITDYLGFTPLWCQYNGPSDCYLPLCVNCTADKPDNLCLDCTPETLIGDSEFIPVPFALKNNCDGAKQEQGWINWGTVTLMVFGISYIYYRTLEAETQFDEDEQTAQDYSIVVKNPPPDAWNPDEWKEFFENALHADGNDNHDESEHGHVTVCTVVVDNQQIIDYLVERRELRRKLQMALPPETPMDDPEILKEAVERANAEEQEARANHSGICGAKASPIPKFVEQIKEVNEKIKKFYKTAKDPDVTKIYVTFETEAAQRKVLKRMSVATLDARKNNAKALDNPAYLFRGTHVLRIREPDEPSTIRWMELGATHYDMLIRRIATSLTTGVFIVGAYFSVRELYKENEPGWAALLTTLYTSLFPTIAVKLMGFERHHSETSRQKWLFVKIATFNILVTTVLLSLITPFQATLDKRENSLPGLLPAVYGLFFSQIAYTPALQLLDIGGNISRHYLAPRAQTQEEMNMCMRGTQVHLATRYANLMKFLVMTLWYCSIYPAVFFMGSFALLITYFVDRFSLMRSWARSPHVGAEIADFARQFFSPMAVCVMSIVSAYFWSGFPYDNLCLDEDTAVPPYYVGEWNIEWEAESTTLFDGYINLFVGQKIGETVTVAADAAVYRYCNQDLWSISGWTFPALPEFQPAGGEWMTSEQEEIVRAHGWSSVSITLAMAGTVLAAFGTIAYQFFVGKHHPRGKDQHIAYSDVKVIDSYIPQISSPLLAYPLFLCNIVDIDQKLFNWQDPERPHAYYDISRDVATILGTTDHPKLFAQVKHWPHAKPKPSQEEEQKRKGLPNGKSVISAQSISAGELDMNPYDITNEIITDEISV